MIQKLRSSLSRELFLFSGPHRTAPHRKVSLSLSHERANRVEVELVERVIEMPKITYEEHIREVPLH